MEPVYAFVGFIILLALSDLLAMVFYGFLCLVGYLLRFFAICLWQVVLMAGQGLLALGRGAALCVSFLIVLIDEWRRGAPQEEPPPNQQQWDDSFFSQFKLNDPPPEEPAPEEEPPRQEQEKEPLPPPDPYLEALSLLGLPGDFTRADFNRAYKGAIRKAHPDTGGSKEKAQAVNTARDCVARRRGWR
ncbi:hypothetical protein FHP25_14740 [Vineibacter terrae]|uniref:J domain-containing protein n=1 Tax=Vineibacter terrae TaxID=2586908 RepID=A0A5C8PLQ5_9HYPH|nr:hypothetical protein [Vineibacter terrae]TXL75139.1 hypothetical protein FHP25_14740 [Vineibacter terrae]